jgi:hypothetical protein
MQFIDHASSYNKKSITLDRALAENRIRLDFEPGAEKLAQCFRPELKIAIAFDLEIEDRVKFNALPTNEKLDLLIDELLPRFFHPGLLLLTDRPVWHVRFVVDGQHVRVLRLDAFGLHLVPDDMNSADVEIDTDIVTLLALLRALIAEFHYTRPAYPELPQSAFGPDEDADVWGE